MKKGLVLVGTIVAGALAIKLWIGGGVGDSAPSEPRLIFNRIWLDRLPGNERDTINGFGAVTRESVGMFQSASRWKGAYELFRYDARGAELRVVYPQTGETETLRARAWTCKEAVMDYCLELAGSSRGVKRYHSRKGWELGAAAAAEDVRARIDAAVAAPIR
jgi:hypothetical protein